MEARRTVLITEGFLRGWLKFDNKTPLSRLREEFLLVELEKQKFSDSSYLRVIMESSLASGLTHSPEPIKIAQRSYEHYLGLALPYIKKEDNIEFVDRQKINDPKFWKDRLALLNKQAKTEDKKQG